MITMPFLRDTHLAATKSRFIFATPVCKIHQLVSVGIVRGPVRVGSHPFDQVVVPSKQGQVQALAPDVGVLVSPESAEIELLVVDQEVICGPPDLRRKKR